MIGHPVGHLRQPPFPHGDPAGNIPALDMVLYQGFQKGSAYFYLCGQFYQFKRIVLKARDRLSKGFPASGIFQRHIEHLFCNDYGTDADDQSFLLQILHEVTESLSFLSQKVTTRDATVLKDQFSRVLGVHSHLFKFLKFFYENYDFIYKISQRDERSTRGCAQWGGTKEYNDQKTLLRKAKEKRGFGKYTALNIDHKKTIEVRIFRGTLNVGSWFKNMEFVKAVFEFSRLFGFKDVGVEEFKRFVGEERKSYGNLWKFMEKRGMV